MGSTEPPPGAAVTPIPPAPQPPATSLNATPLTGKAERDAILKEMGEVFFRDDRTLADSFRDEGDLGEAATRCAKLKQGDLPRVQRLHQRVQHLVPGDGDLLAAAVAMETCVSCDPLWPAECIRARQFLFGLHPREAWEAPLVTGAKRTREIQALKKSIAGMLAKVAKLGDHRTRKTKYDIELCDAFHSENQAAADELEARASRLYPPAPNLFIASYKLSPCTMCVLEPRGPCEVATEALVRAKSEE